MTNQQFRRDFWMKGARKISVLEQAEALRKERVVLVSNREDVSLKITTSLGEANMNEAVYSPILDLLSDHKIRTLGQIEQAVSDRAISFPQIMQAILVLIGSNHITTAQEESVIARCKKQTDRLNSHVISKAKSSNDILFLASPVTGGGVAVSRFQQLFMIAISQGNRSPKEWAKFAWQVLLSQGQRIIKEGMPVESPEENLMELETQAELFSKKRYLVLKALQVL
jgi:hypothetical protein